jgi:hypothetical protein
VMRGGMDWIIALCGMVIAGGATIVAGFLL